MKRISSSAILAAAIFSGAVLGLAPAAQARTDVQLSIGLPPPPVFVRPAPVYVQPRPFYAPPTVVYEQPRRFSYRHEWMREREREQAWRHAEWQRREWERRHSGWGRSGPPDRQGWN